MCVLLHHALYPMHVLLQVLSPFVDAVTKSKVEFVTTSEYEASKAAKASSSSSTWSSWFSSSKASSKQPQLVPQSSASSSVDVDMDIVVEDDQPRKQHTGPGTFGPLLPFYKTAFCFERHQTLLRTAGVA